MPVSRFQQVAAQWLLIRGKLPLELGRQSCAGPARKRIGFVITDMANRSVASNRLHSAQREFLLERIIPVQWLPPTALINDGPAVGQPQRALLIAAVTHKITKLVIRNQAVADLMILQ